MVMQRTAGRRSKPPVLEFARNVDATIAAALEGAGLVYRNGRWQPENTISAVFFMANALAALPVGTPVTVTTTGVVAATSGNVQGIVAKASTAAGQSIPILRQGSMTLTGTFPANSLLYISDKGVLSTTAADTSYFVGFTTTANNAFFLIGGGGGSGGSGTVKVDGTSISNSGGVLSAISTNSPAANTLVRTQANGKISTELLDAPNLFSGMQVRYLVPTNTTWAAAKDKCVVTESLPISVTGTSEYKFSSPFGTLPALAMVYIKNPSTGVWVVADTIYNESTNKTYGVTAGCPGDGYVYVVAGDYLLSGTYSASAPRTNGFTRSEVVVALYCQKVEVTATHIVGSRQKYLIAPGSSWDRGEPEAYITLPDMPTKMSGGAVRSIKMVSPFGNKVVLTDVWVKFAGRWNRGDDVFFLSPNHYGTRSACPGDGFIYLNLSQFPQNTDVAAAAGNIPLGASGIAGNTYTDYEVCIVAYVNDFVDLPTISAKDVRESVAIGEAVELGARLAMPVTANLWGTDVAGQSEWRAPDDGTVTIHASGGNGVIRLVHTATGGIYALAYATPTTVLVTTHVQKGEVYRFGRTANTVLFYYMPISYDDAKYAVCSNTDGGGSTNPSDGLRVGEVRNYSRYDTEIASNASFVNISEATQIDTTAYPEFAALVGVTGQYPIAAASLVGAQTIPYLYLGTYNGGTAPKALTENIYFGPDTTAIANNSILFVTDGDETVNVALVTVDDAENPALTAPALLLSVESDTDIEPIEATMTATTSTTAEPAAPGILIRYEEKT